MLKLIRKYLHRIILIAGIITFYSLIPLIIIDLFFSFISKHITVEMRDEYFKILVYSVFYFIPSFIYSIYKLITNKHPKKILWLLIIIFFPFVGVFLYSERHIIKKPDVISVPTPEKLEQLLKNQTNNESNIIKLIWRRFAAFLIDYVLYISFDSAYFYSVSIKTETGYHFEGFQHLVIISVAWFVWLPLLESINGQTVGKKIMKVTVVNINGDKPGLNETLKRHILDLIDIFFVIAVPLLIRKKKVIPRRLGDYFAKTWVLNSTIANA